MRKVRSIKSIRDVEKLVKKFLGVWFAEFDFDLKMEKLKITDYEFNGLIGFYASSNRVANNGMFFDEYSYYLLPMEIGGKCVEITKRLYVKYERDEDGNYIIHNVSGATETEDCEDP